MIKYDQQLIDDIAQHLTIKDITYTKLIKKYNISKYDLQVIRQHLKHPIRDKNDIECYKKYIGTTHNYLKILDISRDKTNRLKGFSTVCECLLCGKTNARFYISGILKGTYKSCGCNRTIFQKSGKNNPLFTGYGDLSGSRWGEIVASAKARGIPINIDIKFAWNLLVDQKFKCSLTGLDIHLPETCVHTGTASLDRIDSKGGYSEDNVQWIHKDVNILKMGLSETRLFELCKLIHQKQNIE